VPRSCKPAPWRGLGAGLIVAGLLVIGQVPALAAGGATPAVTIHATSRYRPVTRAVYVKFKAGNGARANIHGSVTGAASGEVVKLFAQQFPFKKKPVLARSLTLTGASGAYSFPVRPTLATRYRVRLFNGSTLLATSATVVVYVVERVPNVTGKPCSRPVCVEVAHIRVFLPAVTLRREISKHWYTYFGLRLDPVVQPPPPKWIHLGAGHPRVGTRRRVSADEFKFTIKFSFTIGSDGYSWRANWCTKDTESADGLNLPGRHNCGAKRVRSNIHYLG
jgi:hypothetical protein